MSASADTRPSLLRAALRVVVVATIIGPALIASQDAPTGNTAASAVEDIYVARSMRVGRSTAPSAFCAESNAGFANAAFEDQFTLHSMAVRASDGQVIDANVEAVGRLHACLGSQNSP